VLTGKIVQKSSQFSTSCTSDLGFKHIGVGKFQLKKVNTEDMHMRSPLKKRSRNLPVGFAETFFKEECFNILETYSV